MAHGLSCSAACGIFPDQGSNPCPLPWQADSQPLRHQGSPGEHPWNTFSVQARPGTLYPHCLHPSASAGRWAQVLGTGHWPCRERQRQAWSRGAEHPCGHHGGDGRAGSNGGGSRDFPEILLRACLCAKCFSLRCLLWGRSDPPCAWPDLVLRTGRGWGQQVRLLPRTTMLNIATFAWAPESKEDVRR